MRTETTQGVRDALADAETLRLVAWETQKSRGFIRNRACRVASELCEVQRMLDATPQVNAENMIRAARAAFRAVPALRGEDR